MISVQKVIFPGIVAGCMVLVFVTSLIANPNVVLASSPVPGLVAGLSIKQGAGTAPDAQTAAGPASPDEKPAVEEIKAAEPARTDAEPSNVQQGQPPSEPENNGCAISATYPERIQQWCGLIDHYASENNLDPNLIAAVMLQESGGNPQAYSKSGAVGLLQVMPRDGIATKFMCINGPCFSSRPASEELFDPEFNISYGTHMLAGLIQKNGDVREALRAYGPMDMGYQYADIILSILERYR